jgi:polyhydroxyalkanoate synthesis regulator phasin
MSNECRICGVILKSKTAKYCRNHYKTDEWKNKLSKTFIKKGNIPWNKGKKGVQVAWNKGKHCSEETKKKLSLINKGKKQSIEVIRKRTEKCKGEKHYNWKGGITSINDKIRNSLEYKLWRKSVFERDNYTCIWCGKRNGNGKTIILHADHLTNYYKADGNV